MLYICVMLPLQLTFVRCAGVGLAVVDVLVDLYFIVDVLLNFRTAVEIEGGKLITASRTIARRYLRGWFWLDFASSFPTDYVIAWSQGRTIDAFEPQGECDASAGDLAAATQLSTLLRVLKVVKLLRLLRLARLFRMLERWREEIGLSHNLQASDVAWGMACACACAAIDEASRARATHLTQPYPLTLSPSLAPITLTPTL